MTISHTIPLTATTTPPPTIRPVHSLSLMSPLANCSNTVSCGTIQTTSKPGTHPTPLNLDVSVKALDQTHQPQLLHESMAPTPSSPSCTQPFQLTGGTTLPTRVWCAKSDPRRKTLTAQESPSEATEYATLATRAPEQVLLNSSNSNSTACFPPPTPALHALTFQTSTLGLLLTDRNSLKSRLPTYRKRLLTNTISHASLITDGFTLL